MPPATEAELPEIVQSVMVGDELFLQHIPPPCGAELPLTVQLAIVLVSSRFSQ
jgi:hypothetical protein